MHARVPDDAGWYGSSLYRIRPCCLLLPRRHRHPGLNCFRRSQPGLHTPLSTLRVTPRGATRMTRAGVGRYPFTVVDFHHLPPAGLPAHRGSIPHPIRSLCTLRIRRRRRLRNTRFPAVRYRLTGAGLSPAGSRQLRLTHRNRKFESISLQRRVRSELRIE